MGAGEKVTYMVKGAMRLAVCRLVFPFLLNSARFTVYFKKCFGAFGNFLCCCSLTSVIVESC